MIDLTHNDVPIGEIDEGWGLVPIYRLSGAHIVNLTEMTWTITVTSGARTWTVTITPLQDVTITIPTARRPASIPLIFGLLFVPAG